MNSYLIESLDSLSLITERNKIIDQEGFKNNPLNIYDLEETSIENALEDLDTYSFLSEKKIIIIKGIETIKYDDFKKELEHLFKYIKNPNPNNLLIIETTKLNNTTKIAKELKKLCKITSINIDPKKFVHQKLKAININEEAIKLLIEYSDSDLTKLENECNKLINYAYTQNSITKEDIKELVVKKLGDSKDLTFSFTRSLATKNKKDALKKYHELLAHNIEPLSIIGLLGSQLRIIYQVKLLEKKHLSDKEIANILGEKSDYRITKTRELTRYYTEQELSNLMINLANIDYKIKTSETNSNSLIELFILNI